MFVLSGSQSLPVHHGGQALGQLLITTEVAMLALMALTDGHVYSDGENAFVVINQGEDTDTAWSLYRLIRVGHTLDFPRTPGELAGYSLERAGYWNELRIGDPAKGENRLTVRFAPAFEDEVLPTLEDIADSFQAYLFADRMF